MGGKDLVKLNEIIKICVGGQDFKTTRATLMSDQNSMLAKMFESDAMGRIPANRDPENGSYFIDRSPKYFESILNFLRTGEIECPGCLDMKFLLLEAEYYGIEGMVETIRAEIESKEAFDAHMRKHWEEQNCIQQCCQNYLSQIANYTSRQVEEQRMINYNHPGDHHHHFQQQPGHFGHHFGHHFHHGNHGNHGHHHNHQH